MKKNHIKVRKKQNKVQKKAKKSENILTFTLGLTIITLWGVCAGLNLVFERVWRAPIKRDPEVEMVRWRNSEIAR